MVCHDQQQSLPIYIYKTEMDQTVIIHEQSGFIHVFSI